MARHRSKTEEYTTVLDMVKITLIVVVGVLVTSLMLAAFGDTEAAGMVVRTALLVAGIIAFFVLRRTK